jgi:hypothetical protein
MIMSFVSISMYSNLLVHAHNFVPNDSATFLTRVYRTEVELSLSKDSFPQNVTIALDHLDDAAEVMNDAYRTDDDIIGDSDFINKYNQAVSDTNCTIHALVLANLIDQVLREYGEAFDVGYDLTNMSNMMMTNVSATNYPSTASPLSSSQENPTNMNRNSNVEDNSTTNDGSNSNNKSSSPFDLVNLDDYQSAQELSEFVYLIFNSKAPLNQTLTYFNNTDKSSCNSNINDNMTSKLDQFLIDLRDSVNHKELPQKLMSIVHTKIHPALQLAYNLKLVRQ